ncbi:uncharacterized protein LOC133701514 [Populus nigra]|uniref:uncharacterized protein LOC133701514 n=1 Tax=Populus nigra TaxID=3691 RepID=UPI002B2687E0|nr:uncharacterized protein LOC133701514 [Populus nigra]
MRSKSVIDNRGMVRENRERTISDRRERTNSETRKARGMRGMGGFQKLNEGNQRGVRGEFEKPIERGVGAIDGTHVPANVPVEIQGKFRGRKEGTTQNVLAAITFDLKFIYVLAGWEGSAHDSRVLGDALSRSNGLKIPEGKYYLGDAGYGIRKGIIFPFHGVRYHLNEFTERSPENEKELFNLRHSSLRTAIERGFGILKSRFRSIDGKSFWSYETQVDVVLACCIIHNHIMGVDPYDFLMEEICSDSEPIRRTINLSQREEREENREWITKREMIASTMLNDYNTQRNK